MSERNAWTDKDEAEYRKNHEHQWVTDAAGPDGIEDICLVCRIRRERTRENPEGAIISNEGESTGDQ
jgi:hypothetical protein